MRPAEPPVLSSLVTALLALCGVAVLAAPLWPAYLVARLFLRRPPVVPAPALAAKTLRLAIGPNSAGPGVRARVFVLLAWLRRVAAAPLWAFAWWLDELLYGRALDAVDLSGAVLELSAARSGSTQLAHYLEDDPRLAAPNVLQALFPFVWLWRIVGRFDRPDRRARLARFLVASLPGPYLERHEAEVFRTDTLEVIYTIRQLFDLATHLGPGMVIEEYDIANLTPASRPLWEDDFVPYTARLGRKVLLGAPGRRLLLKGHFLAAADAMAAAFPDARFLTVVRAPLPRLQSVINFQHSQPAPIGLGTVPWPWLVARALTIEPAYLEREHAWFTAPTGPRRVVVRFSDYLRDLPGTLARVYRECLDEERVPESLPRTHAPRVRTNYTFDRSLVDLGIDAATLETRTRTYREWCAG